MKKHIQKNILANILDIFLAAKQEQTRKTPDKLTNFVAVLVSIVATAKKQVVGMLTIIIVIVLTVEMSPEHRHVPRRDQNLIVGMGKQCGGLLWMMESAIVRTEPMRLSECVYNWMIESVLCSGWFFSFNIVILSDERVKSCIELLGSESS
eukprot:TRINITY_DN7229_c0_g2_i1.p2 TRINITY_DN7229_c0_g2~~TRINITY_DN7229_c0_g2_i1.p2  ORF type:complete len:151 (-),score=15.97 TRINITY_DN7229_c0_g2_i1:105-557(-)